MINSIVLKRINRKKFFKILSAVLMLPLGYFWVDLTRQSERSHKSDTLILRKEMDNGIHFMGPVIVIKKSIDDIRIFSSKCTHLGCRINRLEEEKLICPCHGSAYNLEGEPIKGPAVEPLKELEYTTLTDKGNIAVKMT